jgi:predicted Zn-ribbon and HTH transcriptional regulator
MARIYKCVRCGYEWAGRKITEPKKCARCASPYWDKPVIKYNRPRKSELTKVH